MATRKTIPKAQSRWVILRDGKVYSSYVSEVLARKQFNSMRSTDAAGHTLKLMRPDGTED